MKALIKSDTAEDIQKIVNAKLSGYPWGGECFEVHKNRWNEWIANCHVWGQYGRSPEDPNWRYYPAGDKDCPVRQFMVHKWSAWGHVYNTLYEARNDQRLPTFMEEGMLLDKDAPPSPYIVEPIKAYYEAHKNDPAPF